MSKIDSFFENKIKSKSIDLNPVIPDSNLFLKKFKNNQSLSIEKQEMLRILGLPISFYTSEEKETIQKKFIRPKYYEKGFRLWDPQVEALLDYQFCAGAFCPIGVGFGKTLITILTAVMGFEKGIRKILLLIPPEVSSQLVERDIPFAFARLFLGNLQFYNLSNASYKKRSDIASSDKEGCYIFPYSMLSTKNAEEVLSLISPKLIIADEAHKLRYLNSARTRRLFRYINKNKPELVVLSGTITSKSPMDYYHLISASLNKGSPFPIYKSVAYDWAKALAASEDIEISIEQKNLLKDLINWAQKTDKTFDYSLNTIDGFRKAYKLRLHLTPGVTATSDSEIGVSLTLMNSQPEHGEAGWKKINELMEGVEEWETPNGDEIEFAAFKYKWLFELTAGFYNQLLWPSLEEISNKQKCSHNKAEELLKDALNHHLLQQEYKRELRTWLRTSSKSGIDTPMLVALDLEKNGSSNVSGELFYCWKKMKKSEVLNMPERYSEPVRICDYKIQLAKNWAKEKENGIIWYYHQEIGRWLSEEIPSAIFCPAGLEANKRILNSENQIVIASILAHCTGKNLQFHKNNLFIQFPRSAHIAEQSIGRTHRNGQQADDMIVDTCFITDFDIQSFAATLNDTLYIYQTTGVRQKLIFCGYNPLPKIFPSSVLKERGYEPHLLNSQQFELLNSIFAPKS